MAGGYHTQKKFLIYKFKFVEVEDFGLSYQHVEKIIFENIGLSKLMVSIFFPNEHFLESDAIMV